MKRVVITVFVLVFGVLFCVAQSEITRQGRTGNLAWTLSDSTLTISGTGEMPHYMEGETAPWHRYASSIETVNITAGVTSIGSGAFASFYNLTSVNIPNSVTSIGRAAFWGCKNLTSITIPNNLSWIGRGDFTSFGNSGLTSIEVAPNSPYFTSIDGVLFNKNRDTLVLFPEARQGAYTIPNGVRTIGHSAFAGATGLTSVTIPNSVRIIDWFAFFNTGLTSVSIPGSVTVIEEQAFSNCDALTSIEVAANNPNFSSRNGALFNKNQTVLIQFPLGRQGAYTIPNTVTTIKQGAFSNTSLTSITIPSSVTSIECWSGFRGDNLTSVTLQHTTPPNFHQVFRGVLASICIYIPDSALETYRNTAGWRDFCLLPMSQRIH